jgi:uncharacterized membrane protein YeaQ/YmgE (transglycosylase-associated protein family)
MLHIIGFLIIGGVIGLLAGLIVRGHGFGIIGDVVVGVIASLVGGYVWQMLFPSQTLGRIGSFFVSLVCAVVLVALVKAIVGRRRAEVAP